MCQRSECLMASQSGGRQEKAVAAGDYASQ